MLVGTKTWRPAFVEEMSLQRGGGVDEWGGYPGRRPLVELLEIMIGIEPGCGVRMGYSGPGVEPRQSTPHE